MRLPGGGGVVVGSVSIDAGSGGGGGAAGSAGAGAAAGSNGGGAAVTSAAGSDAGAAFVSSERARLTARRGPDGACHNDFGPMASGREGPSPLGASSAILSLFSDGFRQLLSEAAFFRVKSLTLVLASWHCAC